ncbi:3-oxo-5-alpha-steroid 4-dehydrogenase 1 [Microcaecilia unicolor]|uniref:3-oxo-5-alpha-steroid 4-dehydrogenase 1 n=1 Tax=Microcaecilia unicolor TaxID=1415580 RepID=A0A6P7YKD2_9AMPH|nr:3-oxo-5-alpha-steroid 4-dehydrogenase 1 [Microcaecilia unicolor]XP_030065446.1 3-oxo-5-alpha-steroid 4-dehydrogenase 1 [Microcaecilia unicolor]XP_030065455.1 3-oxo-5-alpha-steroid 4-dehydrogenase 1 [Microcaecilia unicolor]
MILPQGEPQLLTWLSWLMVAAGLLSFLMLRWVHVPYGRYSSHIFGPQLPVRLAWFMQELPALVLPLYLLVTRPTLHLAHTANCVLLAAFLCHYLHRTLIFPFLIRGGKPTPFITFTLAFVFCGYNGYLQSSYIISYAEYPPDWTRDPRFIIGISLWLTGSLINIHSDHILRNLRAPGETDYKIPRGGLFEYVSGANFFGEIVEWTGLLLLAGLFKVCLLPYYIYDFDSRAQHIISGTLKNLKTTQRGETSWFPIYINWYFQI